jgi:cytochrome c-type biogenesis protein CcmH
MRWCVALLAFFLMVSAQAQVPSLANQQLEDPAAEARATALMAQLRCIQCQGQAISDSDAPIAAAMRHEVRSRVERGESDAQIRGWLVQRYGEWIDFSPPSHGAGLFLWLLPLVLIAFGIWVARSRFGRGE